MASARGEWSEAMASNVFQRMLIADDGSPDGEHAANVGVGLAAKVKAEVILLGVVEPANVQADGEGLHVDDPANTRRMMEERFERILTLGRSMGVTMMMEIVEGDPAEQINKRAAADQVDLIVVGRRPISAVRRWFEGSTSDTVLRDSKCSVLVVR